MVWKPVKYDDAREMMTPITLTLERDSTGLILRGDTMHLKHLTEDGCSAPWDPDVHACRFKPDVDIKNEEQFVAAVVEMCQRTGYDLVQNLSWYTCNQNPLNMNQNKNTTHDDRAYLQPSQSYMNLNKKN